MRRHAGQPFAVRRTLCIAARCISPVQAVSKSGYTSLQGLLSTAALNEHGLAGTGAPAAADDSVISDPPIERLASEGASPASRPHFLCDAPRVTAPPGHTAHFVHFSIILFCGATLRTAFCGMMRTAQRRLARAHTCGVRYNTVQQVATQPNRLQHRATRPNAETARRPLRSDGRRGRQPAVCDATAAVDRAGPARPVGLARVRRAVRNAPPRHTHGPPHARGTALMCGSPLPFHICTGIGLTCATSAPGLGSPLPHLHRVLHAARLHCACNMHASS